MLSRSSVSKSSEAVVWSLKKDVGGICIGSPTMMAFSPLAMAPTASHVGSCDASSKITRSKSGFSDGAMNCAADIGLMRTHGVSLRIISCVSRNRVRIEMPLPLLLMARCSSPSIEAEFASMLKSGSLFATLMIISSLVMFLNSSLNALSFATLSLKTLPLKSLRTSVPSMILQMQSLDHAFM